jgi:hypothetical protein
MTIAMIGTAPTAMSAGSVYYTVDVKRSSEAAAANTADRPVFAMSAWTRHGTQPDYWTETWLHKEKLADWDEFIGNISEADDVEEMIRLLDQ